MKDTVSILNNKASRRQYRVFYKASKRVVILDTTNKIFNFAGPEFWSEVKAVVTQGGTYETEHYIITLEEPKKC